MYPTITQVIVTVLECDLDDAAYEAVKDHVIDPIGRASFVDLVVDVEIPREAELDSPQIVDIRLYLDDKPVTGDAYLSLHRLVEARVLDAVADGVA